MLAIHIGIGHENDLVVASLLQVEIVADTGTEGRNHSLNLSIGKRSIEAGTLHVEDLTAQRQNGLAIWIAPLHCRTACGVTLHQINFGDRRIL